MIKRIYIFIAGVVASGVFCWGINVAQGGFQNFLVAQITAPLLDETFVALPEKPAPLDINAKAALSFKINAAGRTRTFYQKNIDGALPIASLTKLMSAAVVLENPALYPLNKKVEISKAAASQDDVPVYGNLKTGQSYSVDELMMLMMRYSSNDAAYALAEVMGVDPFVSAMNEKAQTLGLKDTAFFNPNGLDLPDGRFNHSSANDLLALARYILDKDPAIFAYSTSMGPYVIDNGIFDLHFWGREALVGGKTGYTDAAGGCMLVVFKDEKDNHYFNIILGAQSAETRVQEMQKLINYTNSLINPTAQ